MAIGLALNGISALTAPLVQPLFVQVLYWMIATRALLTNFWTQSDRLQDENELPPLLEQRTFDFIVVGGGSAGAVVANRLCRRNFDVLLLEAGGDLNPFQFIPGFGPFMLNLPETDWRRRTVPQKFASLNSVNQESSWSSGLGLGGSGSINLMMHLRGHKKDFEAWANLTGDQRWSWEGVLPYFKSYENYEVLGDNVNHGYSGELRIQTPDYVGVAPEFVRAGGELGYPNVDLNAPFGEAGFDVARYPIRNGERQATYKAFIEPVRTSKRLTIMKYAHVNKVLFRDGNVAYGVQFDRHGQRLTAYSRKEVIISGGTVGSPKILMLSGIGPRQDLEELNIPVVADLPVGQNLQDHLGVFLGPFLINEPRTPNIERDVTPLSFIKWFTTGQGILSTTGCMAAGLFTTELAKSRPEEAEWPDVFMFLYSTAILARGLQTQAEAYNLKLNEFLQYYKEDDGKDSFHVILSPARPKARGFVKLGGSSPYDKSIIDPNYLGDSEEEDLRVSLEAVKRSLELVENTTAFGELGGRFTESRLPGCEYLEFRSDEYWICFIRRFSVTLHHPVGTCALGSVVDSELRVRGTQNLRVMDASVQPTIVTTNTQASTIMIAEMGASMILESWGIMDQGH